MYTRSQIRAAGDAARFAVTAVRRGKNKILRSATPDEVKRFAVGGPNGDCGGCKNGSGNNPLACRTSDFNACYLEAAAKFGCQLKAVGGGLRGLGPGVSGTFQVQPDLANHFMPLAMRATIRDQADPTVQLVGRITAVSINSQPQEIYHDPAPLATGSTGVEINAYSGKSGVGEAYGVPGYAVAWGPFSRDALAERLSITVINDDPALDAFVHVEIWGFPISGLPSEMRCGYHPGCKPQSPN